MAIDKQYVHRMIDRLDPGQLVCPPPFRRTRRRKPVAMLSLEAARG
jgi:hypothetical protein